MEHSCVLPFLGASSQRVRETVDVLRLAPTFFFFSLLVFVKIFSPANAQHAVPPVPMMSKCDPP